MERQRQTPIFVVLGNPPYNAKQLNENDNNKNRKYRAMDGRVSETYARASRATNRIALFDMYVKAIRWASDRIIRNREGIVAFVTNNSFTDQIAFDGMRKHLAQDFDEIYVLDLGGNVRKNPKLSGSTHNVFGIQVGVSINFFIRKAHENFRQAKIYYSSVPVDWRKEQKYDFLDQKGDCANISWQEIKPDKNYTWLTEGLQIDFEAFVPIAQEKSAKSKRVKFIFSAISNGVKTNRSDWAYNFSLKDLKTNLNHLIENYNNDLSKWTKLKRKPNIDDFVLNDDKKISWSEGLKNLLKRQIMLEFDETAIRKSLYRPFTEKYLYFEKHIAERRYQMAIIFPREVIENENLIICLPSIGSRYDYWCFSSNQIIDLNLTSLDNTQCFPFYTYAADGSNRQENLTDWALQQFRAHYHDETIAKWDIFHYIYALLHHPAYREKYAANLRRELPRIPLAPDFWGFCQAGARLAELHVHYEQQPEYPLKWVEKAGAPLNWRVDKMKLTPDKTALIYNNFLTLKGIPPEVFAYKLGNRSALEWVIDQYKVSTDSRSGLTNDPNRADDEQYITRLLGQVITVSLETLDIIKALPGLEADS